MVSDSDLVNRLREILRSSDLDTATAGSIRRQLEKDFGVDLSDRKTFVRDQIDIFLETLPPKQEQEEEEEEEEEVGEESENVKEESDVVEEEEEGEEEEEEEEEEEVSEAKGRKKGGWVFSLIQIFFLFLVWLPGKKEEFFFLVLFIYLFIYLLF